MKLIRCASAAVLLLPLAACSTDRATGSITKEELAAGWRPLFDGSTLSGWRNFRQQGVAGWEVQDGAITRVDRGGDLITHDQFENFDLRFEWRVTPEANSGVFYGVSESFRRVPMSGIEYQILDNAGHRDGQNPKTSAGSNYALYAPVRDVTKKVGEWNTGRIVVNGTQVEHWMNGVRLLAYELYSPDWKRRVYESKFKQWPGYGKSKRGHIALQDHGDKVQFRNIRILELK